MAGAIQTGLDYAALQSVMQMQGIARKSQKLLFDQVRLLERGYLCARSGGELSSLIEG